MVKLPLIHRFSHFDTIFRMVGIVHVNLFSSAMAQDSSLQCKIHIQLFIFAPAIRHTYPSNVEG